MPTALNEHRRFWEVLFKLLCILGKPFDGVRPRRIYDIVGRRAFPEPAFRWFTNRWKDDLYISPHYHIDRNILAFGTYDPDLHYAMERLTTPRMTCMDVGANLGEMALHMASLVGQEGQVFAFEPVEHVFARLKKHVTQNGKDKIIRCLQCALSDRVGTADIAYPGKDHDNQGLGSLASHDTKLFRHAVIPTVTLDAFVQQNRLEKLDFIKLDIQGAEYLFLLGGHDVLTTYFPIIVLEVSPNDLTHFGITSRDLCGLVDQYGYNMFPLNRHGANKRIRFSQVSPQFYATNVICLKR